MRFLRRRGIRIAGTTAAVLAGMGSVTAVPASAATPGNWTSIQPGVAQTGCDGVRATVALDANGALSLGATWNCRQALTPAPIGLVTSRADFTTGLEFVGRTDTPFSYSYEVTAGKSRVRTRAATETRLVFAKGPAQMTVHVRTSADGMALRYELPSAATVLSEATTFELPTDAQLSRQVFSPDHERGYATSAVADVPTGSYDMGMFAQQTNGARVLLAESGVDGGYSGGRFTHNQGTGRFSVALADAQIVRSGAFTTAWRTAVIGSTATIVESTLVDDVAPASKVSDTSWIKPGVAAWPLLDGMGDTQRDLTKLKQWADYASSQG
jgi:alpha-glucosidase